MLELSADPPIKLEIPGVPGEASNQYLVDVMIRQMNKSTYELSEKAAFTYLVAVPLSKVALVNTEIHDAIKQAYIRDKDIDTEMFTVRVHMDTIRRNWPTPVFKT